MNAIRSEARRIAKGVMLGQVYCRDAHKPNLTFRDMLECYHRHYHDALRLFSREEFQCLKTLTPSP